MRIHVDVASAFTLVGTLLRWLSVTLLIPLLAALIYDNSVFPFLVTLVVSYLIGLSLEQLRTDPDLELREAFLMVSMSWLIVALVGSLPYILADTGTLALPVNAFFESMSGFTTTGSTVMGQISLDHHGHAMMLWRQLTQWLGGMGIIVLAIAILPKLSVGGAQLMQQEAPGPTLEKLTPHIAETARRLWLLYMFFTVTECLLLYVWHVLGYAPKMHLFNAISHALTTLPTGGFSPEPLSVGAFTPLVQWTIIPFMVIAGTNFSLLWFVTNFRPEKLYKDEEWKFYCALIALFGVLTSIILFLNSGETWLDLTAWEPSIRHGLFQAVAFITTTGYATIDFTAWPMALQGLLFVGMFVGGCAGSTGGSVKIVRWLTTLKTISRELFVSIHSSAVRPLRIGTRVIKEDAIRSILIFMLIYVLIFLGGSGIIMLDSSYHGIQLSLQEAMGNAATAIGNVGPSFGGNGPMNNFLNLPLLSRIVMALLMWLGRLEIVTVLVIFTKAYWTS